MKWTMTKKEAKDYLESIVNKKWIAERSKTSKPLIERTLSENKLAELKRWAVFYKEKERVRGNFNMSTE